MGYPPFDYCQLTVHERLRLIGDIWASIAEEAESDPGILPLTDVQRAELDRRLAEHERDPESAVPWDEALDGMQQRLRSAPGPALTQRRAPSRQNDMKHGKEDTESFPLSRMHRLLQSFTLPSCCAHRIAHSKAMDYRDRITVEPGKRSGKP